MSNRFYPYAECHARSIYGRTFRALAEGTPEEAEAALDLLESGSHRAQRLLERRVTESGLRYLHFNPRREVPVELRDRAGRLIPVAERARLDSGVMRALTSWNPLAHFRGIEDLREACRCPEPAARRLLHILRHQRWPYISLGYAAFLLQYGLVFTSCCGTWKDETLWDEALDALLLLVKHRNGLVRDVIRRRWQRDHMDKDFRDLYRSTFEKPLFERADSPDPAIRQGTAAALTGLWPIFTGDAYVLRLCADPHPEVHGEMVRVLPRAASLAKQIVDGDFPDDVQAYAKAVLEDRAAWAKSGEGPVTERQDRFKWRRDGSLRVPRGVEL